MTGLCIGIDFGTSNMTAYVEGKGIVFSRPSVVACDSHTGRIIAHGEQALAMTGRNPASIEVVSPLCDGVVSDVSVTAAMIKDFVDKCCRLTVLKPNIIAGIPSNITSLERKAILDVLSMADVARICIMEHTYAAAIGADVAFAKPCGTMIIDIGGGTVDIAVVTMGSIAASRTIRTASEALTNDIIRYLRRERDIEVGYLTADYIKRSIGGAVIRSEEIALVAKGRNIVSGAPINFEITSTEVYWAIKEHVDAVLSGVKEILSEISPELSADIIDNGIMLTGGGALLRGLDLLIMQQTGMPVYVAERPLDCVVDGTGRKLDPNFKVQNAPKFI